MQTLNSELVTLNSNCSVVILAGGRSSRMGSDKALLKYGGKIALEYLVAQLKGLFGDIVISVNQNQNFVVAGCRMVVDELADFGPLAGISAGLRAAKHETVFVVAVDSPIIDRSIFDQLLAALTDDCIAVMPESNGRLEPLYAVYSKRALVVIDKLIQSSIHRVTALADCGLVKRIVLQNGRSLDNINTQAD